jgi:phosphohistidine phosphatase SixA
MSQSSSSKIEVTGNFQTCKVVDTLIYTPNIQSVIADAKNVTDSKTLFLVTKGHNSGLRQFSYRNRC